MRHAIGSFLRSLGRPHLVEFDYRDSTGLHHGRCYVRCLFDRKQQTKRLLHSFGYTNIQIGD